ncbi:hypothetical protein JW926_06700 [Candidatus Sumerlaeota bacterium]|nr:hypothetical protein [Candidatus Sumerlaeota bacterium]
MKKKRSAERPLAIRRNYDKYSYYFVRVGWENIPEQLSGKSVSGNVQLDEEKSTWQRHAEVDRGIKNGSFPGCGSYGKE